MLYGIISIQKQTVHPGHWYAGQSSRRQTLPEGMRKSVRMSAMSGPQWCRFATVIAGRLLGYIVRQEKTFPWWLVVAQPSVFLFWRATNEEKATSSVLFSPLSVLRQPFCFEKRRRYLSQQLQEHHVICLQQIPCLRFVCTGTSWNEDPHGHHGQSAPPCSA